MGVQAERGYEKECVQEGKNQKTLWWPKAGTVSMCVCEIGSG